MEDELMIAGIGLDIVELERMANVLKKQPRFPERILTLEEFKIYQKRTPKRQLEFLAGRFAAKEAFSKAMGTGIGKTVSFQNVSILNNEKGQPIVVDCPYDGNVFVTITHSTLVAAAQVILEK